METRMTSNSILCGWHSVFRHFPSNLGSQISSASETNDSTTLMQDSEANALFPLVDFTFFGDQSILDLLVQIVGIVGSSCWLMFVFF